MNSQRRTSTLALLLIAVVAVWWLVQVEREVSRIEILTEEELAIPSIIPDTDSTPESWDMDQFKAFFIEYRLQRDRVRASEVEMLNQMIDNPNMSAEGKKQAEEQLLKLVSMMEKEMLVENMLKAHGYKDAIFFYQEGLVNVVVQAEQLTEQEFLQIAEMVSTVTGVKMEEVTVVEHNSR
ncbi:MAG: SpoIIIAH-like family protein [Clostridiales bacterium]|jgi:stage III sporulation protein AH|nr:SpoIIIAH-like family protein [Clostridiales bacterium]